VRQRVRDAGVAGSNPATPTRNYGPFLPISTIGQADYPQSLLPNQPGILTNYSGTARESLKLASHLDSRR
jgi:hypothetical protein